MFSKLAIFLALCIALCVSAWDAKKSYNNHRLVRMNVASKDALKHLQEIVGENVDVWNTDGVLTTGVDMDVLLPAQQFEQLVTYYGLQRPVQGQFSSQTVSKFEVLHHNVQDLINAEAEAQKNAKSSNSADDFFVKYRTYDEVKQFTQSLQHQFSNISTLFTIGNSWENREIFGIKISVGGNGTKPVLMLNALQHAREWISIMVVSYAMKNILEQYTQRVPRIVDLLNKIDIFIIPCVNPDGYTYTYSGDRLWRKNRRNNGGGVYGVDLNRNWKLGWGVGASRDPHSIIYQGPSPLSEPESQAYDKFLRQNMANIKAGIDFHSYSQLVLRPWDYQSTLSADETKLKVLGASMQSAIKNTHGLTYQNIRGIELYAAGGALNDNFYGEYKFFGYTIELRDTGHYGFLLPPDQIVPCSEENWNAILTLGEYVSKI